MKHIMLENFNEEKSEAERLAEEYYSLDVQMKSLDKRKKEIATILKDSKAGDYKLGDYMVSLTEITSMRLDTKLVEQALKVHKLDILDFKTESKSKRMSVKRFTN